MKLEKIWKKNKTTIIVAVILIGIFFVFSSPIALYRNVGLTKNAAVPQYDSYEYARGSGEALYYGDGGSEYYPEEERMLRKTANVELEVKREDYGNAKLALEGMTTKYDGYYTNKNERKITYGDNEYRVYTMTIKVPVDQFEDAVDEIKTIANLEGVNVNAYDMTTQYYDVKTYLDNYQKEKEKLDELYDMAEEIEDLIAIQERLTEVQRQIDRYQAQLDNIERQTDYSSIYVTLSEERDVVEGFYEMTGLRELWRNIVMSFDNVFVFISRLIGWVIIGLLILGGIKIAKKLK